MTAASNAAVFLFSIGEGNFALLGFSSQSITSTHSHRPKPDAALFSGIATGFQTLGFNWDHWPRDWIVIDLEEQEEEAQAKAPSKKVRREKRGRRLEAGWHRLLPASLPLPNRDFFNNSPLSHGLQCVNSPHFV